MVGIFPSLSAAGAAAIADANALGVILPSRSGVVHWTKPNHPLLGVWWTGWNGVGQPWQDEQGNWHAAGYLIRPVGPEVEDAWGQVDRDNPVRALPQRAAVPVLHNLED